VCVRGRGYCFDCGTVMVPQWPLWCTSELDLLLVLMEATYVSVRGRKVVACISLSDCHESVTVDTGQVLKGI